MSDAERLNSVEGIPYSTFDYIICGGGTAGLTVAARLSEDAAVSVLVLEAGNANLDDPVIMVPAQYTRQIFDDRYDWKFWTTPQKHAGNKPYLWPRGKSLGGSSAMNFLVYMRPPAEDINAWEELGNPGWNWETHLKYMKRSERITPPTPEQSQLLRQCYDPEFHGTDGPLQVGFPSLMHGEVMLQETLNNVGIPTLKEAMAGEITGGLMTAATIDPVTHTRSYAPTAYYLPNKSRPNLRVLTQATVNRITFADVVEDSGLQRATGVEFTYNSETLAVKVTREVIVSAGGIKSPQILELSGIGDPSVLDPLSIKCVVPLPGVGSNVQEHVSYGYSFELDPSRKGGWNTMDALRDPSIAPEEMKSFKEKQQGRYTLNIAGFAFVALHSISSSADMIITAVTEKLTKDHDSGKISDALWDQYKIQLRKLKDKTSVDFELLSMPQFATMSTTPEMGKEYITLMPTLNRPFSRGSIHIASNDPLQQPACDPHYFENDIDLQILVEGLKWIRKLKEVEPFKSMIVADLTGDNVETDEQIRAFIINELTTTFHTASACSMLPREKGGVVDPTLKVYGTANVRVVDLSIVPLHIASHPLASVYGIAEQAADIIRGRA